MRFFEVPYNWDKNLIEKLQPYKKYIKFLFLPCFKEDGFTTREQKIEYIFQSSNIISSPNTREQYQEHLNKIREGGFETCILFQGKKDMLSEDKINFYIDTLNINNFTITNPLLAKKIKNKKKT